MTATLDSLARENGTFLMVAMDQRESLRQMLAERHGAPIEDDRLRLFKLAVARTLAPHSSAFLIDRLYGFDAVVRDGLLPDDCGLILAPTRSSPGRRARSPTPSSTRAWTRMRLPRQAPSR